MSKPTHLLLVSQSVEQEQTLFDWILAFAKQHDATITVLHVLPEIDHGLLHWFTEVVADVASSHMTPEALKEKQSQNVLSELVAWQTQAKAAGVMLEVQVLFGKLFYRAIQYVLNHSVDWLIKQTDEASHSLIERIFDSHDLHLLRKCPCPVLLYKQGAPLPFKKVMACLDVNLDDGIDSESGIREPDELNQRILGEAVNLLSAEPAYLEVLHAWQADAEHLVRHWNTDFSEEDMLRFTETIRHQHLMAIETEITALNAIDVEIELVLPKGKAEEVIPLIVEQHSVDLLVMGTLGRHGLPGIIIGNTSESILEQVNCSVLALKPSNFISPVKP